MSAHPILECRFQLGDKHHRLPQALASMRHHLEDLAHSQVGQWKPFEVRLILPAHLLHHPSANQQIKQAGTWLSNQGWTWLVLTSTAQCASLRVLCRTSKNTHPT